ncbi:hypothetical protein [Amycolatopsis palatopharyngis]|uniref:hypothetical protein n=1 Tax=Amycolatopsis palatopharyngis TaxID=187982 RepID=UPI000E2508B9|nr:hypothetical protein [Amycolatopsis palatopharyngis]
MNAAALARLERHACPVILRDDANRYAHRAVDDALQLITDVRDLDPRQLLGRLVLWGREEPPRLAIVPLALAAMHSPRTPMSELGAYLEQLAPLRAVS